MKSMPASSIATPDCRVIGSGPDVLLIHGWMVTSRVWDRLLPLMSGYRLLLPELPVKPGSGRLDDYVGALQALCDSQDLRDTHLVGHSMGGQLAALLAARAPERFRSLILLNPVPVDGLPLPDAILELFGSSGGHRERQTQIIGMASPGIDPEAREWLLDDAARVDPDTVRRGFDAWRQGQPGVSLAAAAMPSTVVATDDPFLPAAFLEQAVVARLPAARLEYLSGPGHYPQVEQPAATAALLRRLIG